MNQQAYGLSVKSQLSASPQLQQSVRLLQMSAIEFEQEMQLHLASNPFLEEAEIDEATANEDVPEPAEDPDETALFDHADPLSPPDVEEPLLDASVDPDPWESSFESVPSRSDSESDNDLLTWVHADLNLHEHLRQQLCGARLSERELVAAMLVIESLDDDGYIRDDIKATARDLNLAKPLTHEDLEGAVGTVQRLDPAGIGARTLHECLMLQLRVMPRHTPALQLARTLVGSHLEALARHDYCGLQRRLDCSAPSLAKAHALIRTLDPRPGQKYAMARTEYIVPDVLVTLRKGRLNPVMNPAVMPRARLNRGCIDLLRQSHNGSYPAMQQQLQEARWLLRNAEQRHLTILRVASAVIARQRAFFQYGEIALKPLMLREVADELGLHESTLSRATANKYMATPRGVFEFRHFFSRQLATETGGTCSATAVRAMIKELIEAESRDAPLSDVSLARKLTEHGVCVARRTVAKYRNQLKMPPWELRYLP